MDGSVGSGRIALPASARILPGVSLPSRVVRSVMRITMSSAQSFASRLMLRLASDAARLHQAIVLRRPDVVVIDTSAIRREYGDAGLGPVVGFVRERAPNAAVAVRPSSGAHWLVGAEAGEGVEMLPADTGECVEAV